MCASSWLRKGGEVLIAGKSGWKIWWGRILPEIHRAAPAAAGASKVAPHVEESAGVDAHAPIALRRDRGMSVIAGRREELVKLMFGALIRAAERWRAVKVTEFERRQLATVRQDLDQEYEARISLKTKPSSDDTHPRISSTSRI